MLWRLGAAVTAPRDALRNADRDESAGQAPTDLTIVMAALFVATNLELLARAGYLVATGSARSGLQLAASRIAAELQWPLLALLAGFVLITALAGRRRRFGADSDLACVAFLPAVVVWALAALVEQVLGPWEGAARWVVIALALGWFAAIAALAVVHAQDRVAPEARS